MEFSGDELILAMVSLIRATDPAMLGQGPEGFSVDFVPLENKQELSSDEQLLLRFREALEGAAAASTYGLDLCAAEGRRLAEALDQLDSLHPWPRDVQEMSRRLCARLRAVE